MRCRERLGKSKVLNRERVRFKWREVTTVWWCLFDFRRQVAFVKFIGTHTNFDRVDVLTISQY